jgi:hypothetical protein
MERQTTVFDDGDTGGEGRAGELCSERSDRFVEKLMERLARHNREAEQLAEAMAHKRRGC